MRPIRDALGLLSVLSLAACGAPADVADTTATWDPDAPVFYLDGDGDGVGGVVWFNTPEPPPEGDWVTVTGDCDDDDPTRFPGATEDCDGVDQDCDGQVDEDAGETWYADVDLDGVGSDVSRVACEAPPGWVAETGDCDDTDAWVFPGASEVCDGVTNDCDSAALPDAGGVCGTDVTRLEAPGDRVWLAYTGSVLTFPEAAAFCAERGYRLVQPTTPEALTALDDLGGEVFEDFAILWVGMVYGDPCGTGWSLYDAYGPVGSRCQDPGSTIVAELDGGVGTDEGRPYVFHIADDVWLGALEDNEGWTVCETR